MFDPELNMTKVIIAFVIPLWQPIRLLWRWVDDRMHKEFKVYAFWVYIPPPHNNAWNALGPVIFFYFASAFGLVFLLYWWPVFIVLAPTILGIYITRSMRRAHKTKEENIHD